MKGTYEMVERQEDNSYGERFRVAIAPFGLNDTQVV